MYNYAGFRDILKLVHILNCYKINHLSQKMAKYEGITLYFYNIIVV